MAAPRSIGSLTVSFGLVAIPVKLFTATQSQNAISFNMLHKGCGSRLKQQYVCIKDGSIVERDEMIKGYEFAKDQYVTFTTEELKALEEKATQTVDIAEFVPLDKVDPVYFDKPYWIGPQEGGEHAYQVVEKALEKSGKVGIGRFVLRSKESLVALRPRDGILTLATMRFDEELIPPDKVNYEEPKKAPGDREVNMAAKLVDSLAGEFKPDKYEDTYREAVLQLVEKKAKGETIEIPDREPEEETDDLMAALEASLSGSGKS